MPVKYTYHTIVVLDVEGFGRRPNTVQSWLRERLRELWEDALGGAGIDWEAGPAPVDRGDGCFLLLPGTVPKEDVTGPFVERLRHGLIAHARTSGEAGRLRLRLALHGGEVGHDGHGWVGADLNTACRMVDHQPLRDALASVPGAELVVAVSDEWHRKVISHAHPGIDAREYRPVRFDAKEISGETVWVRVPGHAWSPPAAPVGADDPRADWARRERAAREPAEPESRGVRIENNSGIGFVHSIAEGGIGVMHGSVHQVFGERAARPPGRDEERLARELEALRGLLKEALERRDIDDGTYRDAAHELDTAEGCAEAGDRESRGTLTRALVKLGALVAGVASVAEPVRQLIETLRGGE
ncbi:hypothetical protein SAMN06297387_103127 [Streptomyces zhaozhouensis]|uniref:Guanylate cyclase domain-containing protein n=1 Tax=Streptomyces zhaozhouensis TaxID=1300267 RepID=A0A286DRR5_9ACTN|nr:hypothetical protein [Streptomyces zhaozhouensis]SOD61377.1 hypothetical protein SAMN06297387_103127 [Streptomyces zhaozhouensis]